MTSTTTTPQSAPSPKHSRAAKMQSTITTLLESPPSPKPSGEANRKSTTATPVAQSPPWTLSSRDAKKMSEEKASKRARTGREANKNSTTATSQSPPWTLSSRDAKRMSEEKASKRARTDTNGADLSNTEKEHIQRPPTRRATTTGATPSTTPSSTGNEKQAQQPTTQRTTTTGATMPSTGATTRRRQPTAAKTYKVAASSPLIKSWQPDRELRLGTDFSGLETASIACERVKIRTKLIFACEKEPKLRELIRRNFHAGVIYRDVLTRDISLMPTVDLFISCAPCPPWSQQGKHKGINDSRGSLLYASIDYIVKKKQRWSSWRTCEI